MDNFSLKNHQNKCRMCFKILNKRGKHVTITEDIENKFNSVTQIHLKSSPTYSNQICVNCDRELLDFSTFKSTLVERQTRLYSEYPDDQFVKPEPKAEILQVIIKQETENDDNDFECGFNDNLEMLRDNMEALKEPVDESRAEKPKKGKGSRGGPINKQRRLCPDCGELATKSL